MIYLHLASVAYLAIFLFLLFYWALPAECPICETEE